MHTIYSKPITKPEDMLKMGELRECFFSRATDLPVSFVLDGKAIKGIPDAWSPVSEKRIIDANIIETIFQGTEPKTGLNVRVECTEYRDYPIVEWMAWFTNKGPEATPLLSDILAMNGTFQGSSPVLYHCNGDFGSEDGYKSEETPMRTGDTLRYAPNGGRCCDGAFPYYRIMFNDWGLTLAIGWSGQWAANFNAVADGVQVHAGQEKTNLRLMPGESIRTPRMTALAWSGDSSRAINLWRRWYLTHVLPRPNGQLMKPHLACCGTGDGEEFTGATEENQIQFIEKFKKQGIPFDVWWIDAGWYPCDNPGKQTPPDMKWWNTGTWEPDPERFPRGLKAVSDRAAQNNTDLLLWFEPERVWPGTALEKEHPEWLLKLKKSETDLPDWLTTDLSMLNLGNPACRQWLTDHVCNLIKENGIKIYRQDFNFPPLEHWRKNEPEDRQGMNENLYVQGYLQYWDDLLERNPGLWIDSCSSGGRRNDLDTMRRSVPLHYSDYGYGIHNIKMAFHRTLFEWLPYFKDCTISNDFSGPVRFDVKVDSYSYHCGMAPMLFPTLDIRRDDYDFPLAVKMIGIWHKVAPLMLDGDFYPHTPVHRSDKGWVAWQFNYPETGCGFIQGIRFPASPDESLTIHPEGLCKEAKYVFENPETGETKEISGEDIIQKGFTLKLQPRSGEIWLYRREEG